MADAKTPVTVVVADEEIVARAEMVAALRSAGYVGVDCDPRRCVAVASEAAAGAVMLAMAASDWELAALVKSLREAIDPIAVIGLTSNAARTDDVRCRELGLDCVLLKPCAVDDVTAALARHAGRRRTGRGAGGAGAA